LTVSAWLPDKHFFRGSFGGHGIFPLYRDSQAAHPNIAPCLRNFLGSAYGRGVSAEDFAGYVYAMLAQPEYTARFRRELGSRQVRVPLTKDGKLFFKAAEFGKELIWLHTYGERLTGKGRPEGQVPRGAAKCLAAVSDTEDRYPNEFRYEEPAKTLYVGDGKFGPVEPEVFEFEVSGLKVVKSWLGYRMRERSGKKSSPLDAIRPRSWTHDFTHELLELLWVLERTVAGYPAQKQLLEAVLDAKLFKADELPPVPAKARKAPEARPEKRSAQNRFDF
jgi:hypothetical protein